LGPEAGAAAAAEELDEGVVAAVLPLALDAVAAGAALLEALAVVAALALGPALDEELVAA